MGMAGITKDSRITVKRVVVEAIYDYDRVHPECHKKGHVLGEPRKNPRYVPHQYQEGSGFPMPDLIEEGADIPDRNEWIADCSRCGDTLYCEAPEVAAQERGR